MLKFKDFLNEETGADVIEIDSKYLLSNKEKINTHLDTLTEKPYQNAPIFLTQLRGALELYGMMLPAEATINFVNLSAELVYALGDTGLNLYIVYDTNEEDGFVDGYAQIVTSDELDDLVQMDTEELLGDREEIQMRPSTWYAKRDDDSGNTDEYS
jgi:hypothetical protein